MTRLTHTSFASAALVAAAVALSGLLSPIAARAEQNASVLTSQRPWLAPVGHRQPRRADAPQDEGFATREREQRLRDKVIDQSLIICRC